MLGLQREKGCLDFVVLSRLGNHIHSFPWNIPWGGFATCSEGID